MLTIQQASWQQRQKCMSRLEAAWVARAAAAKEGREEPRKKIRREQWPKEWPSRGRKQLADDVDIIENGRIDGLALYCYDKMKKSDAFYVVDLGCVEKLYESIIDAMPRIRPHFAIKCFPNLGIIKKLVELKCGFDCASKREVEIALQCGAEPDDIIFANPCKRTVDLECIGDKGIPYTTFDSLDELIKVRKTCPHVSLVLRIRCDDPTSRLPFGAKYGALESEVPILLKKAFELDLSVVGISFHVGSGARSAEAYREAIKRASKIQVKAWEILDIGGGFCGDFDDSGKARVSASGDYSLPDVIDDALSLYFPKTSFPNLKVIAEPGRYFAESSASFCTKVIGTRRRPNEHHVWIADGCYGAFNAVLYDAWAPSAAVLSFGEHISTATENGNNILTTVFGPTCDSLDCVFAKIPNAPPLHTGDWLLFPNCGAYTAAGATDFNGIPATSYPTYYIYSQSMHRRDTSRLPVVYSPELPFDVERHF